MEVFTEQLVAKKLTTSSRILKALTFISAGLLALIFFLISLVPGSWSFIALFAAAGVCYGAWILIKSFNIEYEYILTNSDLDIDKIVGKSRRKRIISLNLKNLEIMAPINESHKRELENPNVKFKLDARASETNTACFIKIMHDKKGLTLLLFEPNEKIIRGIKSAAPRKVLDT